MITRISVVLLVLVLAGCASRSKYDRSFVSEGIEDRTSYVLGEVATPGEQNLPGWISLGDGLSQDEAVAIALWNNARFQVDLTQLGFARAELAEAKFFSNPVFSLLFPVGPKGLEAKLNFPIAELWQRPSRVAAAKINAERVAENLVQHGLGLIRDVQSAYFELLAAEERLILTEEYAGLSSEIVEITRARLRAGDISELESSTAIVDALRAEDAASSAQHEAAVLKYRFNELLGLNPDTPSFRLISATPSPSEEVPIDELLESAFAARPDLRAHELAIEAAGKRVGLEYSQIVDLIGIIDSKDKGEENLTTGPGFQVEIPILNQNQPGIIRAKTELEMSLLEYAAARRRIILEVEEAHAGYELASTQYELWYSSIVPSLEDANDQAQKAHAAGDESYLFVLAARRTLVDARLRQAELAAQIGRAIAQLNFSAGRRIIPAGIEVIEDGSEQS